MEKLRIDMLSNGLYLSGADDKLPQGTMRRYRGLHPLSTGSLLSRDGSAKHSTVLSPVHSLVYFNSLWYIGNSTVLCEDDTTIIITGLSGNALSFAIMAPVAGGVDALFIAGGGTLYKVDQNGDEWYWGITAPNTAPVLTDGGGGGSLDDDAIYKYAVTYYNSATGHRSNPNTLSELAIDANTQVLLHFDSITIETNSISGGPSFTETGTVFQSWAPKFGQTCAYFPGSSDYLTSADDADFDFDSGDFTISFWIDGASGSNTTAGFFTQFEDTDNYVSCYVASSVLTFEVYLASAEIITLSGSIGSITDTYHLITICRDGNDWTLYKDGVIVDTDTVAADYPDIAGAFNIGRSHNGTAYIDFEGLMDEFILIKGTALYSTSFNPPTTPFGPNYIDLDPGSTSVDLSAIPQPEDTQVDIIELWRTFGGGTIYFKLTNLPVGTTTYTDDIADTSLLSLELPTDNIQPFGYFDDCYGPWNASMFWITRTQEGERGRVYYSPVGRAEAVQGFIEVTSDSDGLQKLVVYAGNLYVFSSSGLFQIYGTNPYYSREIPGVAGTNRPGTVVVTPFGIVYESPEGIRLFNGGAQSQLIAYDAIKPIFRGRAEGNLTSFSGLTACFARGEYMICTGTQAIAVDMQSGRWRDLGFAIDCIAYDPVNDVIGAAVTTALYDFEKEGTYKDDSTAISIDIQTGEINFGMPVHIDMIRTDCASGGETLSLYAYTNTIATLVNASALSTTVTRKWTEHTVNSQLCERLSLRVSGSTSVGTASVEFYAFEVYYTPCVLHIYLDGEQEIQIPARFSGDYGTLTFEDFSENQATLRDSFLWELFRYDLNTVSTNFTPTLTCIGQTPLGLGTLAPASRTIGEVPIMQKGRFEKLAIASTFTSANVRIYRLELHGKRR